MKKYTQLVIIRYPASGETIAYRRDDPDLIDTLIDLCNIEYDDTVLCAELEEDIVIEPIKEKYVHEKTKIDNCSMTPRLHNLMCNLGYEYLEDVHDFWIENGDKGLLKMKSFGRKSLIELLDIFAAYDFRMTTKYDFRMTTQENKNNE